MKLKEKARCTPIARTGRVQDWIDSPESRLAVSCTTFVVEDSMEGPDGIEASWRFVSHALRNAAGAAIHLSKLRPVGEDNGKGLIASGPVSFAKIYSKLNEILRRGGTFRNGAVTLHLDYDHPDAIGKIINGRYEPGFVDAPRSELPWAKRCLNVDQDFLDKASPKLLSACLKAISNGDLWLIKKSFNKKGERIYGNVCLEVLLPHRGTCLLQHVNLGACSIDDLEEAFTTGMKQLCDLHPITGVGDTGEYLSPEKDKQVGLGMLGLANFLSIHGISYKQFGDALEAYLADDPHPWCHHWSDQPAGKAVAALQRGILSAADIAKEHGMERAFCIAPTASCSYRYLDSRGFTTAPEIAPPIDRIVDRDSETMGVERFEYGPVEIAEEVGWQAFRKVADGICELFNRTGLYHGYSMNWFADMVTCDEDFLREWLDSPQTSLYYALQVQAGTQAKDDVGVELEESLSEFFSLDEQESCSLDDGFCAACSE
jgi:hypothetical protein